MASSAAVDENELLGRPGSAAFNDALQHALAGAANGNEAPVRAWARANRLAISRAVHVLDHEAAVRELELSDAALEQAVGFTRAVVSEYAADADNDDELARRAGALVRALVFTDTRGLRTTDQFTRVLATVYQSFKRTGELGDIGALLMRGGKQHVTVVRRAHSWRDTFDTVHSAALRYREAHPGAFSNLVL